LWQVNDQVLLGGVVRLEGIRLALSFVGTAESARL
jgi:hypothetical protein